MNQSKEQADCTILILTYKGKHHLEFLLPTVRRAIENTPEYRFQTIILDNGCHDETRDWSQLNFPEMEYRYSEANDYLFSLNPVVKGLTTKTTFILNDDMKFHPDVLKHILPCMEQDANLFGVCCNIYDWDGTYSANNVRIMHVQKGWLSSSWANERDEQLRYTLYGGGGATIFDTQKFNALGGFNDLYRPAYCEDLDLGHQAWKRGWKTIYHPKAILYHREGGTIKDQFKKDQLEQKIRRNQILWMVRNGDHPTFKAWFSLLLPWRLLKGWTVDKNSYFGLWKALPSIGKAKKKQAKASDVKMDDAQMMKLLQQEYVIEE